MKLFFLPVFLLFTLSEVEGQSEFDRKVSELYFNLPMYGGFFEMQYAMQIDTAFRTIFPKTQDHKTQTVRASFITHPLLEFLPDSAEYSYTYYDSSRTFVMRRLSMVYDGDDEEKMFNQFQQLFNYFEPLAYMYVEEPDHDKYPGQSFTFYPDPDAFSSIYPSLRIHYNQIPRRNNKGTFYTMSVSYTEEK